MNWWPFGKETAAKDGPNTLLDDIEKRGKQYLDDIDTGRGDKHVGGIVAGENPPAAIDGTLAAGNLSPSTSRRARRWR